MYNELNTVFSLSSLFMVALNGGPGSTGSRKVGKLQSESIGKSSRSIEDPVKYFNPHSNAIATGLCSYKFITSKVLNRIPEVITEVYCDRPGSRCHKEKMFHCVQERARLEVAYVTRREEGLEVRTVRNITTNIGCTCAVQKLRLVDLVSRGVNE